MTKALLWGGPHDGWEIEVTDPPPEAIRMPDPTVHGQLVVYRPTNRLKGQRRIYRIVRGPGC